MEKNNPQWGYFRLRRKSGFDFGELDDCLGIRGNSFRSKEYFPVLVSPSFSSGEHGIAWTGNVFYHLSDANRHHLRIEALVCIPDQVCRHSVALQRRANELRRSFRLSLRSPQLEARRISEENFAKFLRKYCSVYTETRFEAM